MSLPQPKELLKSLAQAQDMLVESLSKPVKQLASTLNLPELPELPKAVDIVESLPELPAPPLPGGGAKAKAEAPPPAEVGKGEVTKVVSPKEVKEKFKIKIV